MRHLPKVYTLGFVALLVFLVMVAAYAVSESAVRDAAGEPSRVAAGDGGMEPRPAAQYDWYEDAAMLVCPLH